MARRINRSRRAIPDDLARERRASQIATAVFVVLIAALLPGCPRPLTPEDHQDQLRPRAAYELDCPVTQIKLERITGRIQEPRYRASGCGMELTYDLSCQYSDICIISTNPELTEVVRAKRQADSDAKAWEFVNRDD